MTFKTIVLIVFTLNALYDLFLTYLRRASSKNAIPECVKDVYDTETHLKQQAYYAERCNLKFVSILVSFIVGVIVLVLNGHAAFASLFAKDLWTQMFAVLLLTQVIDTIFSLPFSYYSTFVIEEKYGFNKTKNKTFITDTIIQSLLALGLMLFLGWALMFLYETFGNILVFAFPVITAIVITVIGFFAPIFAKLNNKFTPLPDGELKTKLTAILEKNNYKVRAINVMDASRRSTKTNAYFTGYGKMKTIVLYDTLIEKHSTDEIVAIFAHEVGHGIHKDTLKGTVMTFFQMALLGVLGYFVLNSPHLFAEFGFEGINYGFTTYLIMQCLWVVVSIPYDLISNYLYRSFEYRADAYAKREGYADELIAALKKLSTDNLSDVAPNPTLVALVYTHPTLAQRIEALRR